MNFSSIAFDSPWLLIALAGLPLLWWLLRVTPPSPRQETFPAVRLLLGLSAAAETPARTPWWLLAMRMFAAALIIVGLARPIWDVGGRLPGDGPVLLVLDDGWASASDWAARIASANAALDRAERAGRQVALLTTAPSEANAAPQVSPVMAVPELRTRLAPLRPKPWPADRAADAAALHEWVRHGAIVYIGDGLTDGRSWDEFSNAMGSAASVIEMRRPIPNAQVMLSPVPAADRLTAVVMQVPHPDAVDVPVLAQSGDARTLARVTAHFAPNGTTAEAAIKLPPELRNQLARLVLEGPASAGSVMLLDERFRRRPVGLVAGDATVAESPLTGSLFYLRRALEPYVELRSGDVRTLLSRDISVLILADHVVTPGEEHDAIANWVNKGGLLIRFAGPAMAENPDDLLPVHLLTGDRQLGGAMSWSKPAALAPFDARSPFSGLAVPADVRITEQVLAEPGAHLAEQTWARLADGTPLVTQLAVGSGRIVLFHVTANSDWSDLALSGLYVDMLRRLVDLSVGVASASDPGGPPLAPAEILDGFGQTVPPTSAASAIGAGEFDRTGVSARHPPGLYGPANGRRALNLSAHLDPPEASPTVSGASVEALVATATEHVIAPWLIAAALALLAFDLLLSLRLRGLWRSAGAAAAIAAMLMMTSVPADAQTRNAAPTNPALATRLAYVITGDAGVDGVTRSGLSGLSNYVNHRTAAALAEPAAVTPGEDDLSYFPLLYWAIAAGAQPSSDAFISSLNDYMAHGGIIVIDTRNGGSGEGFAPGTDATLEQVTKGLTVPPLAPLTSAHVLARAFYLLQDFPGRYDGDTVWVQRDQDRTNDSVSPVIIGGLDWAAAWAVDADGHNPFATIPGGTRQRTLAYRFGVNLVMYALTGNYKGDQVHVPALLERLGQ